MSSVSQRGPSKSPAHQVQCQCDLAQDVHHYKTQVLDLQARLAVARKRNFDLQQRLEDVEGAIFQQAETPCGDEAEVTVERGDGVGPSAEGEDEISLVDILAQEQAQVASDPNWPESASALRLSIWAKHKLLARVLQELWKEEHILLSENSKIKQRLEREREESILQENEAEEWRSGQRDLHKENLDLALQISRLEEQLSRIAQLTRND